MKDEKKDDKNNKENKDNQTTELDKIKYKVSDEDKNTIFEKVNKKKWKYANFFIIFLVLFSIIVTYIGTLWNIRENYFYLLFYIDLFISTVFLLEYLYRLQNSSDKRKFPFYFLNILDLLSFLPFFLLLLISWPWIYWLFAIFRIFRVFRIIELFEKMAITKMFLAWLNKHKLEIIIWFFVIFLILITFSSSIYMVEYNWGNSNDFSSLPKATWWGIYALTTSWDAWLIPTTFAWRVLAGILMSIWPMFISIISSVIVIIFLDSINIINLKKETVKCKECKAKNDLKAKYCMECGEKL